PNPVCSRPSFSILPSLLRCSSPLPPTSTLFPYTTLFRSSFKPDVVITGSGDLQVDWGLDHADHRAVGLATVDAVREPYGTVISIDRKSTRLNSSHVSISYAVFCLKKKNKNEARYIRRTR